MKNKITQVQKRVKIISHITSRGKGRKIGKTWLDLEAQSSRLISGVVLGSQGMIPEFNKYLQEGKKRKEGGVGHGKDAKEYKK